MPEKPQNSLCVFVEDSHPNLITCRCFRRLRTRKARNPLQGPLPTITTQQHQTTTAAPSPPSTLSKPNAFRKLSPLDSKPQHFSALQSTNPRHHNPKRQMPKPKQEVSTKQRQNHDGLPQKAGFPQELCSTNSLPLILEAVNPVGCAVRLSTRSHQPEFVGIMVQRLRLKILSCSCDVGELMSSIGFRKRTQRERRLVNSLPEFIGATGF